MAKNNVLHQQHLPSYPSINQTTNVVNVKGQGLRPSFDIPSARQGSSLRSQPCPINGPTAMRQLVRQPFVFYLILLKKYGILFRTRVEIRYVNYRVALDDEIAICFLSNLVQKSIVPCAEFSHRLMLVWQYLGGSFHSLSPPTTPLSYLQKPSFIPRTISYCSELFNLPPCCSLVGTLFQLSWNSVPIQLEHHTG